MIPAGLLALAIAAPGEVALEWEAPASVCPTRAKVEARVAELIGRPLGGGPTRLHAWVTVARDGGQWRGTARIRTDAGESRRALKAAGCDAVGEAVAVILALALDTVGGSERPRADGKANGDEKSNGGERSSGGRNSSGPSAGGAGTRTATTASAPDGGGPNRGANAVSSAGPSAGPTAANAGRPNTNRDAATPATPNGPNANAGPAAANAGGPNANAGATPANPGGPNANAGPTAANADPNAPSPRDPRRPIVPGATTTPGTESLRVAGYLGAQWAWETAMLPAAGSRLQLGSGVVLGALTLELGVDLRPRQQVRGPADSGADVAAIGVHAAVCYDAPLGALGAPDGGARPVSIVTCAGAEGARLFVQPFGTTEDTPSSVLYGAAFGEVGPRLKLFGDVWGTARLRILVTARRPQVTVDGDNLLFSPASVGVSGSFGVEVLFGDG